MKFLKELWSKFKIYIIGLLIISGLSILLYNYVSSYYRLKNISEHNIIALTDSIKYYKSKNGDLVAEKTILLGDMETLKLANEELYNKVKDMKVKNPETVIYTSGVASYEPQDTVWSTDTIIPNLHINKDFAFNNEWRALEGNICVDDSTASLNIQKDEMYFDYTTLVKDGKVYISSTNPYIKYNEITGITLPKTIKKKWSVGIGPSVGYGYAINEKKFTPYVGISVNLHYNLFSFGSK